MAECIDPEARAGLLDLHKEISKTQRFVGEVASVLWGDHERRDNGLRSKVNQHEARLDDSEEAQRELHGKLRHYLDVERQETCHGLKALSVANKQSEELRKARLTFIASLVVGVLSLASAVAVAMINKSPAPAQSYADIARRLAVIEAAVMPASRAYPDPSTLKPLEEPAP